MRKKFEPAKCPQEKILDARNTHENKMWIHEIPTKVRWHDGARLARPTMVSDPRNLKHSQRTYFIHQ